MITVLTGDNSFELHQALDRMVHDFDGQVERIDGSVVETKQLPDMLMGATLFANKRLVIIKGLSANKAVWNDLSEWLPRVSDDISVVFVDVKPDKRTKTFKDLKKIATIQEFAAWTDRDIGKVEQWVVAQARDLGITIDRQSIRLLVERIGTDQWQLHHALEKLSVMDVVTPDIIEQIIDANPVENVFNLFEAALKGDPRKVTAMIRTLEITEDPYMVFGLLSGQVFQLAGLVTATVPSATVAKDLGAHPFALSKLAPYAKRINVTGIRKIMHAFGEADDAMKSSGGEPWLLVERALIKTATI
jgi:DNA polymerase III delta subunit